MRLLDLWVFRSQSYMNKTLLYFFSSLVLGGCNLDQKKSPSIYFAGEIVNPTSDYVVLYRGDEIIDSAKLNNQNRFSFTLDTMEEGLHHFNHSPEIQYVFFEKGDSLQVRLNTVDFDESLAYSGTGEEINNFLLEMYLSQEKEESYINTLYILDPETFSSKIDSLIENKLVMLSDLKNNDIPLSDKAMEIAKASVEYNYFIYKEKYPYYHKRRTQEDAFHNLPEDFYAYRDTLNYNNKNLSFYRPYYNYMKYHYGNLTFKYCKDNCDSLTGKINNNLHFYQHKLDIIDSLVHQTDLRDNLFRNVAMDYLLKSHDNEENNAIFIEKFHKLSANNKHLKEVDDLYHNINNIQPGHEIPNIEVETIKGTSVSLKELSENKDVVFYFWSETQKSHLDNINKRIHYLSEKNPKLTFIGINVKTDKERWLSMVNRNQLDSSSQYRASNYDKIAKTLVVYDPFKGVIVKDGKVVDAFANLYRSFN